MLGRIVAAACGQSIAERFVHTSLTVADYSRPAFAYDTKGISGRLPCHLQIFAVGKRMWVRVLSTFMKSGLVHNEEREMNVSLRLRHQWVDTITC